MRPGTTEDVAAAVEVWRASLAATGNRPSAKALADTTSVVETSLFVLDEQAMAAGKPTSDSDLELLLVSVLRRGEGLGTIAVEALADAAWDQGFRTMSAWTDQPGFLEAIGFTRTGRARDKVLELTAELEAPVREVVAGQGIRLGQLLKLAEIVETGAEGKALLTEGAVEVNGEVELRRGRQLLDGDEVRALDQAVRVVISS
jgi:ribosome-associated protein